jgi:hypothetical protein
VLDIIVLRKVKHFSRASKQPRCLRVETTEDKTYYFAFGNEEELDNWLTDIHSAIVPCGNPTQITHEVHVEPDKNNKNHLIVSMILLPLSLNSTADRQYLGIARGMAERVA